MAFSTHLQQVLAYLKAGNKIQPPVGTVLPQVVPATPNMPGSAPPPSLRGANNA